MLCFVNCDTMIMEAIRPFVFANDNGMKKKKTKKKCEPTGARSFIIQITGMRNK